VPVIAGPVVGVYIQRPAGGGDRPEGRSITTVSGELVAGKIGTRTSDFW
jgi:hypothetical protein